MDKESKKRLALFFAGLAVGAIIIAAVGVTLYLIWRPKKSSNASSRGRIAGTNAINIACVNYSTVVTASDFEKTVAAVQKQVTDDFAPIWDIDASLYVYETGEVDKIPEPYWICGIFDDTDQGNFIQDSLTNQADALGYHGITSTGEPYMKVFAKTVLNYGAKWSVTFSHEILETLVDPSANANIFYQSATDPSAGVIVAMEVCDPCQADVFGYKIDGITVSDFVLPSWFELFQAQGPYDFAGYVDTPLTIISGGYALVYTIPNDGSGWKTVTARSLPSSTQDPSLLNFVYGTPKYMCDRVKKALESGRRH